MKIKIEDDNVRKLFFDLVKLKFDNLWINVRKNLHINRNTFDKYRSGEFLIPEEVFLELIVHCGRNDKSRVLRSIKKYPDNFGQVLGGRKAYRLNMKAFEEGRKKGMARIRFSRGIERGEMDLEIKSVQLSSEICEFIGAFIGEGCFNCYGNKLYQIEFAGDSRYDLLYYKNIIIPMVTSLFPDIRPHIYKVKSRNSIRVVFYSKKLFYFLKDYFGFIPGKKAYTVKIPDKILTGGGEFVRSVIRGIFDTDGCVFFDRRSRYKSAYPRIVLQIKSKPLYDQLEKYLSSEFSLYSKFSEKRRIYVLEIYGRRQFNKWMSLIGFSNKRHLDRITPL